MGGFFIVSVLHRDCDLTYLYCIIQLEDYIAIIVAHLYDFLKPLL